MSTASSNTDIATKYQKLAAEYAKLRAQVPILKKAVVDEQTKNTQYQEDVRVKDQSARKLESEVESLVFRNEQLTKRVEHLQERLDVLASPKNKKVSTNKKDDPPKSLAIGVGPNAVLEEELRHKLAENEKLHSRIFELEQTHEQELHGLEDKFRSLETENTALQKDLASIKNRHQAILEELRAEKDLLDTTVTLLQEELGVIKTKYQDLNDSSTLNSASTERFLSGRLLFDDTEFEELNALNASTADAKLSRQEDEAVKEMETHCQTILAGLGNFVSYSDQRSTLYPCDESMEALSDTSKAYCAILKQHSNFIKPLSTTVLSFLEKCHSSSRNSELFSRDLMAVIESLQSYVTYLRDSVLPLFLKSVDDECAVSWCNKRLEKENGLWRAALPRFVEALDALNACLADKVLSATTHKHFPDTQETIQVVLVCLDGVAKRATDLSNQYSLKVTCEHQLPTATKKLRTTNECLLACLNSMAKAATALTDVCTAKRDLLFHFTKRTAETKPGSAILIRQATEYANKIAERAATVSTVSNAKTTVAEVATSEDELKVVKAELEQKSRRIIDLEKEKEHWTLETELLKMKLGATEGRKRSTANNNNNNNNSINNKTSQDDSKPVPVDGGEDRAVIEEHYSRRLEDLMMHVQTMESRAAYFQQECATIIRNMHLAQRQKEKVQTELRDAGDEICKLKDDLETTRSGYETQMNSLSEHLAEMNLKLTAKTEEIDMLRQAMSHEKTQTQGRGRLHMKLFK